MKNLNQLFLEHIYSKNINLSNFFLKEISNNSEDLMESIKKISNFLILTKVDENNDFKLSTNGHITIKNEEIIRNLAYIEKRSLKVDNLSKEFQKSYLIRYFNDLKDTFSYEITISGVFLSVIMEITQIFVNYSKKIEITHQEIFNVEINMEEQMGKFIVLVEYK